MDKALRSLILIKLLRRHTCDPFNVSLSVRGNEQVSTAIADHFYDGGLISPPNRARHRRLAGARKGARHL